MHGLVFCSLTVIVMTACGSVQNQMPGPPDSTVDAGSSDTAGAMYTVSVALAGNGSGNVTSNPPGISCPGECNLQVTDGTSITLTAMSPAGSMFLGWSGGACGVTNPCTFTVTKDVSLNASFGLNLSLVVTRTGTGTGSVTSNPAGINCGADCSEIYQAGAMVTLTATAAADSTFTGWTGGGCSGTGTCTVTIGAAVAVDASFALRQQTLTTSITGAGSGKVTSALAGINCAPDCSEVYPFGTVVVLTATPDANSTFAGWSGACTGTSTCTATMNADRVATATFTHNVAGANVVFVTSTDQTTAYGGLAGADSLCQTRAQAAGLGGTYRAWLSTTTASAISRLGSARGWVRPDGKPVVDTTADLATGKMFYPIRVTELGTDALDAGVQTATAGDGTLASNSSSCGDWTVADSQPLWFGSASGMALIFTQNGLGSCRFTARLYCFGIDNQMAVTVTPAPSFRRAFSTSAVFAPGGGIAAADALCASEASSARLPGTYKALLATTAASAASRFNITLAPWGRVDGILLAPTPAALFSSGFWDSALTVHADGTLEPNGFFWGGATSLTATGTTALTCGNWASTSGTGGAGNAGQTSVSGAFTTFTSVPCDGSVTVKLACLQQ